MLTWLLLLVVFLQPSARSSVAQEAAVSEAEAKAAFLYNFVKFIEWPPKAFAAEAAAINVMVYGDDDFAQTLSTLLKDKKAHGRSFTVKKMSSLQEAKDAHILFVAVAEGRRMPQINDVIRNSPTLTVGESEQFFDGGGMINFVFKDKQLRFEINVSAAERSSLTISSRLLRLAERIKREGK